MSDSNVYIFPFPGEEIVLIPFGGQINNFKIIYANSSKLWRF